MKRLKLSLRESCALKKIHTIYLLKFFTSRLKYNNFIYLTKMLLQNTKVIVSTLKSTIASNKEVKRERERNNRRKTKVENYAGRFIARVERDFYRIRDCFSMIETARFAIMRVEEIISSIWR